MFDSRLDRKVLLIMDNCAAHANATITLLKNTEVLYLPPGLTSRLQPMDAGIIRLIKAGYRRYFCKLILRNMDTDIPRPHQITILNGIRTCVNAWDEVTATTIANCFEHCHIRSRIGGFVTCRSVEDQEVIDELEQSIRQLSFRDPMSIDFLLNILMNKRLFMCRRMLISWSKYAS